MARYYSSTQGRFTGVDPENAGANADDPQSWNGYGYSRNNPVLLSDPDGREYKLCPLKGECTRYSDADVEAWRKQDGVIFKKGKIFDKDGNQIGTYRRLSDDNWTDEQNRLFFGELPKRTASHEKAVVVFAGASVAGGVALSLVPAAGVTTLGLTTGGGAAGTAEGIALLASQLQFTVTTALRQALPSRQVPIYTLAQAILHGQRMADPQGAPGAIKIVHEMWKNGKKYQLEIIYREADKTILHFLYK